MANDKIFTRAEMLNACRGSREEAAAAHSRYYGQIVDEVGVHKFMWYLPVTIDDVRKALAKGERHLSHICKLNRWDLSQVPHGCHEALTKRGDFLTRAGKVCILEAAAKKLAESN